MAYIGRPLQVANLAVQSGTGDGSDTTPIATLDYATVTNGIAVYLDGVRQLAGTDFNVTAQTTLTFTTAPANGVGVDVYFLGLELSIPTPADVSVTAAKIASNAVTTAKIIDDAVTLAKMAPGTDGNIISYDASGNPVAIATGSDGQVLTSAGAGQPPAFEAAAAGGKLEFVETNAITAVTSIRASASTAWEAGYDYIVTLEGIALTTDSQILWLRFSDDNTNFEADAADYAWTNMRNNAIDVDSSDSEIQVGLGTWGNDASTASTLEFTFANPMGTSERTTVFWNGYHMDGTPDVSIDSGGGVFIQGTVAVQAVQFLWSGGSTFKAQGDITVWRRKRS